MIGEHEKKGARDSIELGLMAEIQQKNQIQMVTPDDKMPKEAAQAKLGKRQRPMPRDEDIFNPKEITEFDFSSMDSADSEEMRAKKRKEKKREKN